MRNPEMDFIPSVCRLKYNASEDELRFFITMKAIQENDFTFTVSLVKGESFLSAESFIALKNAEFISDVKRLIRNNEQTSDSPLAHKIASVFVNSRSIVSKETKDIARVLLQSAKILESPETRAIRAQQSDRNVNSLASEIIRAIVETNEAPEKITDKKLFYSTIHKLLKSKRGKKRLESYSELLISAMPDTIDIEQIREIISVSNGNDRAMSKRKTEKNKRASAVLSAIAKDFSKHRYYTNCEKSAKLGKKSGTRLSFVKDGKFSYVKVFCYDCRTSVCYPVAFHANKPLSLAKRVRATTGDSLAHCKAKNSLAISIILQTIQIQYNADYEIWKRDKAVWRKRFQTWINVQNGVSQTALGCGIGKNISDRKPKNRIRTR
jgi:hypothetical protein